MDYTKLSKKELIKELVKLKEAENPSFSREKEKYSSLINNLNIGVYRNTVGPRGVFIDANPAVVKIFGYKNRSEFLKVNVSDLYQDPSERISFNREISENGFVKSKEVRLVKKSGQTFIGSVSAVAVKDRDGKIMYYDGIVEDISSRLNSEDKLKESQRRLSTLIDNLPGMAYRCKNDKNWSMDYISNGVFEITGYKSNELINNKHISYNDLIVAEDQNYVWDAIQNALKKNESFRLKYRVKTKNNGIKWLWEQGTGVFDAEGKLLALEGFITDISEQVKAEEEIRKLSRSVEQSPTIVIIADLDAKIEYVNPRFTEVTGYSLSEILGKNPRVLKSGNTPKQVYKELWDSLNQGREWFGELQNRKKNGQLYWESANIFPLKDDAGKITHFIAMKEDITARKKMEEDLISAKEKAEESDKLKSSFLANMSHEIRTPMNAIIGFSQLLNEPGVSDEEKDHYISLIQNSGDDLMSLIDDIIDISKIEAGQMKIYKSRYFVHNILKEIFVNFSEVLKTMPSKANLNLIYKEPNDAKKISILTDIDRFKQVFRNLISNAIKFTDHGKVEFGFSLLKKDQNPYLEFYVKDTGIGIAEDKQKLIFKSFTQANESHSRIYGGTGLGLSITKRILEILGGEIRVNSKSGRGSSFYFTLPFTAQDKSGINTTKIQRKGDKKIKNRQWNDKRILVVEDDDNSFLFLSRALDITNISVKRANDGLQAISMVSLQDFDAVLLDIQIPGLNGYDTARKIKDLFPDLMVIAQTAFAMESEKRKCFEAGCDDYISKPVKIQELLSILTKYLDS
ncbi:MAG: PAS domain S-box protein [Bacteroidales bacterium]|nr:PAS domain S-box protein [Bacteroidales bacterium]